MASYLYEMAVEPIEEMIENISEWDMSVYDEIEDFQCTTDFYAALHGEAAFA